MEEWLQYTRDTNTNKLRRRPCRLAALLGTISCVGALGSGTLLNLAARKRNHRGTLASTPDLRQSTQEPPAL